MINQVSNGEDVLAEELLRQNKQISLNPLLIVFLIEQKVISLSSWQKKFSVDLLKLPESVNSVEIIEFLEIFIINGLLDKEVLNKANIPDLISLIEILSKSEENQLASQWKLVLDLFELSDPFSHTYEEITDIYLDQWFNSSDIAAISNKLLYKIKIVFKNSQNIKMFFKLALEKSIELTEQEVQADVIQNFLYIDRFIHLAIQWGFTWIPQSVQRVNSIIDEEQILKVIWEVLDEQHTERLIEFNQIPFRRILMALLRQYFNTFKSANEYGNIDVVRRSNELIMMFWNLFIRINPSTYPCFSFSWVELISSPYFLPFVLDGSSDYNKQERWFKLHEIFSQLFKFLKENIYENSENCTALQKFFEGTFKLCLTVLHDYPEFLWIYYFDLINSLPLYKTGVLRNAILAAYPKSLRLPDPSSLITKFDAGNAFNEQDKKSLLQQFTNESEFYSLKSELDAYISNKSDEWLKRICEKLEESQIIKDNRKIINTGVVHAAMLYLASDIDSKKTMKELEDSTLFVKYEQMCKILSTPVRDILLNSMFNELRFLNASTLFFMNAILEIFRSTELAETPTSSQIVRIWIERCKLTRIQPWGLLAFECRLKAEPKYASMNLTGI